MRRMIRHMSAWALAGFFAWSTVVLAAAPLRALRLTSPFWVYWPMTMLMTSGLWMMKLPMASLIFAGVAVVVGLFTEIETLSGSRGAAGVGSIVALLAGVGVGFGSWCRDQKVSPLLTLQKWVELGIAKVKELNPSLEMVDVQTEMIVANAPSIIIGVALVVLGVAVVSERSWVRILGSPEESVQRPKWTNFRVWDEMIFVLMGALLASFTNHGVKPVILLGTNVLNAIAVLYFFQGMAVVFNGLARFRVGPFWRLVIGFLLTFQLALLVACVGVADYWLDFRARLNRINRGQIQPPAESK